MHKRGHRASSFGVHLGVQDAEYFYHPSQKAKHEQVDCNERAGENPSCDAVLLCLPNVQVQKPRQNGCPNWLLFRKLLRPNNRVPPKDFLQVVQWRAESNKGGLQDTGYRGETLSGRREERTTKKNEEIVLKTLEEEGIIPLNYLNAETLRKWNVFRGKGVIHSLIVGQTDKLSPADTFLPISKVFDIEDPKVKEMLSKALELEKYLQSVRLEFARHYGFKISKEDSESLYFYTILACFNPLNGILSSFREFEKLFWDRGNENGDLRKFKNNMNKFHNRIYKELSETEAFKQFKATPTLELFAKLDDNVKGKQLLQVMEPLVNRIIKKNITRYGDKIEPPTQQVPASQEQAEAFSESLEHEIIYDFASVDYGLSSFLLEQKELYLTSNIGKYFVCIDLKSANFNSLRLLDPNLVLGASSWGELSKRFDFSSFETIDWYLRLIFFFFISPKQKKVYHISAGSKVQIDLYSNTWKAGPC